ncbi:MAG: LysR substrate-binding domain-containing protein [Roseobacter sp.]|jgi:LysR family glycine cleavage system transcriptional activator|nr:LysR substrate-binding domain-containing protein [Roseobacter sp.]
MKKALPPITWFRAFDATARHLSFTIAAQELGFTQSAISQNVRALEEKLGTPLFIRGHRALSLTQAGRLLVPDVAAAMAQLEQATARFLPVTARPKLTIATSVSIAQWVIAPRLSEFMTLHPEAALQISTTIWPDDFASTAADIEIRFGTKAVVGLDASLLQPSQLHTVAAPHVAAALPRTCDTAGLSQFPLIQPVGITSGWNTLSKAAGLASELAPSLFVDTHGLAADLAAAGAGIALTHCLVTQSALRDGRLVALPLPALPAEEGYYLAVATSQTSALQTAFVEWFKNSIA